MKNLKFILAAGALCASGTFFGCESNKIDPVEEAQQVGATPQSAEGDIIPDQYIIGFHPSAIMSARARLDLSTVTSRADKARKLAPLQAQVEAEINTWLAKYGINEDQVVARYTTLQAGVALNIPKDLFNRISKDAAVASVEHDRYEYLPPFTVESVDEGNNRAQTTPCGITNAGGTAASPSADRWIWIVDTGIDLDHPDLNVNLDYDANYASGSSADDCNGHGTHCAGIAAAVNNTIGVVGVSNGATVVPVRVFGCSGPSATSIILNGINWVGANDMAGDVCNLSLGGYYGSGCSSGSSYLTAINALASGGTRVSIAAGNDASNAALYQPACISGTNIYTIAAMTCAKAFASSYSNYGKPPVDYIATGSSVYSTYKNGGYATLTGTSMAAPHVAGIMQYRNAAPATSGSVSYSGVSYAIAVR